MPRCFVCGNKAEVGSLCKTCYRNANPPVKHFKPLVVRVCQACNAIHTNGTWNYFPTPDTVPAMVRDRIQISQEYEMKGLIVNAVSDSKEIFHPVMYEVKLLLKKGKHEFEEDYEFPIQFDRTQCQRCLKKRPTYFEGTLQIRGISALLEEFVETEIQRAENQGVYLSKRVPHKNGYDYFLSSNKFCLQMGQILKKNFGGEMKISKTLHTRKGGKDVFRMTVLFTAPMVFKDDIVEHEGGIFKITSTTGKLTAKNLANNKSIKFDPKIKNFKRLVPYTTTVSKVKPRMEVIHPSTFQSVPVKNPKPKAEGERVRVVYLDDHEVYFF